MNSLRSIFQHARVGLIALCLALCTCLSLVLLSGVQHEEALSELMRVQGDLTIARMNLRERQSDLSQVQSHIGRFHQLARSGLLGTPERAAWVEQLQQSRRRRGLPESLSYILHPASPASRPAPTSSSRLTELSAENSLGELRFHELEFKLQDVHEEELLDFLQDFDTHAGGRFRVDACQLSEPTPQGLSAHCSLRFFTMPWVGSSATTDIPVNVATPNRPAAHASHLDTLVYSPAERDALVRERRADVSTGLSTQQRVSGIVQREHGRSTVWINQHAVAEGQSLPPAHSTSISATGVTLDGQRVRVGETLNLNTLERGTVISPQALTLKERK
jgi:hypothetical protein